MGDSEIIKRLSASEAVTSLTMEGKVAKVLERLKWTVFRSPYFIDSNTGKAREIDVLARNVYHKKHDKHVDLSSSILLMVECKSLTGYHIVVDGNLEMQGNIWEENHKIWAGYDEYNRYERIKPIIDKSKLSEKDKEKAVLNIKEWLFPNDTSVMFKYCPQPYQGIDSFTSYRETNIGTVKELDNSVLWKSFLSLSAASDSYESSHWKTMEDSFISDTNFIVDQGMAIFEDMKPLFFYRDIFRHISIHKILVIDSQIWELKKKPLPIKYFRFAQQNVEGMNELWVDVVSMKHMEEYFGRITNFYNSFFKQVKLRKMSSGYLP